MKEAIGYLCFTTVVLALGTWSVLSVLSNGPSSSGDAKLPVPIEENRSFVYDFPEGWFVHPQSFAKGATLTTLYSGDLDAPCSYAVYFEKYMSNTAALTLTHQYDQRTSGCKVRSAPKMILAKAQ